jgi:putative DNA primase/helicase
MSSPWLMRADGSRSSIDEGECRRALALLIGPVESHELRGLPSGRSRLIHGSDLDGAIRAVASLADEKGVYYTLNPVSPTLGDHKAATVKDVTCRRNFLIDVDPIKASKDDSSTDAEKEAARIVAESVRSYLDSLGWPAPLVIDSGNGWHLVYRVDLPNDDLSRQWLRLAIKALATRFNTDSVDIDRKVHNASRISKLPGTMARKGVATPDRPHRPCRLVSVPADFRAVPDGLIRGLAGLDEAPTVQDRDSGPSSPASPWTMTTANGNEASYYRSALEREVGKVATSDHHRNDQLHESALKLGGYVAAKHLEREEVVRVLAKAAESAGLGKDGDPEEISRAINNGLDAGAAKEKHAPKKERGAKARTTPTPQPVPDPSVRLIILASEVVPKKIRWMIPGRIPLGKLTTFAGRGGLGKTFVLCDMSARQSNGGEWPFCGGEMAEPGRVLFVSGEDDPDDTLVPRLIQMGADLTRIAFMRTEIQDQFTLADLPLLDRMLEQLGPDCRFVAIDPPTAFLGGVDDHRNADLRGLLGPLKNWAARHQLAVVFNTHINKAMGSNIDAAARVMGSVAWVNAVRAAYMFAPDPEDDDKTIFACMKINIARRPKALSYRIVGDSGPDPDMARLEWLGEVDTTADEALNREKKQPRKKLAREWLTDLFSRRLEWSSDQFWAEARANDVSKNAINEARVQLGMPKPRKVTQPNGEIQWVWWVPPDWPYLPSKFPDTHTDAGDLGYLEQPF